jgi:micrococcal nuclease
MWLVIAYAIAVAVKKALASRSKPAETSAGPDQPSPPPEVPASWVEPSGDVCPASHPVKAKLSSKIFHVPGSASYDRTNPDRCYVDAAAAEADGLRPAKR